MVETNAGPWGRVRDGKRVTHVLKMRSRVRRATRAGIRSTGRTQKRNAAAVKSARLGRAGALETPQASDAAPGSARDSLSWDCVA